MCSPCLLKASCGQTKRSGLGWLLQSLARLQLSHATLGAGPICGETALWRGETTEGISAWVVPSYICCSEGRGTSPGWITITSAAAVSWITSVFFSEVTAGALGTAISIINSCGSGYALRICQHPKTQQLQSAALQDRSDPEFLQSSPAVSQLKIFIKRPSGRSWCHLWLAGGSMGGRGGLGTVSGFPSGYSTRPLATCPMRVWAHRGRKYKSKCLQYLSLWSTSHSLTVKRLHARPRQVRARDTSFSKSL